MKYVENVMNQARDLDGVILVMLKDLRKILIIVGNKEIDELIQVSQLNTVHCLMDRRRESKIIKKKKKKKKKKENLLKKFRKVTYITRGVLVKFIQQSGLMKILNIEILKTENGIDILTEM